MTTNKAKDYQIAALLAMLFGFTCIAVLGHLCKLFLEYLVRKLITDQTATYHKNTLEK